VADFRHIESLSATKNQQTIQIVVIPSRSIKLKGTWPAVESGQSKNNKKTLSQWRPPRLSHKPPTFGISHEPEAEQYCSMVMHFITPFASLQSSRIIDKVAIKIQKPEKNNQHDKTAATT
jgi:hypothetical protein